MFFLSFYYTKNLASSVLPYSSIQLSSILNSLLLSLLALWLFFIHWNSRNKLTYFSSLLRHIRLYLYKSVKNGLLITSGSFVDVRNYLEPCISFLRRALHQFIIRLHFLNSFFATQHLEHTTSLGWIWYFLFFPYLHWGVISE